ncbi:MAG: hypothetical protein U0L98_03795 [Clostridia bacterium]|nr:hypothetical protein [Clostridia bacterium]
MKKDKKVVITGQMVANVVSILSVIVSILLIVFDSDKKSAIIFLVFSLLWLSFNILNNKKKEN